MAYRIHFTVNPTDLSLTQHHQFPTAWGRSFPDAFAVYCVRLFAPSVFRPREGGKTHVLRVIGFARGRSDEEGARAGMRVSGRTAGRQTEAS